MRKIGKIGSGLGSSQQGCESIVFQINNLPLPLVRWWFREYEQAGKPINLCIHPREFDPAQPRLPLAPFKQWKAQVGLAGFDTKVESLLAEHRFDRMGAVLGLYRAVRPLNIRVRGTRP
jgi:hypothetical protein